MIRDIAFGLAWIALGVGVTVYSHWSLGLAACALVVLGICTLGIVEQYRKKQ